MAPAFRFNATRVFLTYAQTNVKMTPEWLLSHISTKAEVKRYCISQERHVDGGYHLHSFFEFKTKLDTKSARFFDVKYYREYHPNILKVTKEPMLLRYIKKQGEALENFDTRPPWLVILEDTESETEFLTELMWKIGRIDNYSGYRTLRDLRDLRSGRKA